MSHVVVVGAGQAAASLVSKLRSLGFEGQITVIGEEPAPPYQRPPLSKAYLLGDMELDRLFLRPAAWYDDNEVTLRLGARVERIDTPAKTVQLDGESIAYDMLALTTGAVPNRLPNSIGGDLDGVHTVRTLADVDAMAPAFREGARAVIVGGGYIGLEAAAVAAKKGLHVTLVEMAERILGRVAAPQTSDYFRELHKGHGVDIREGVGLAKLTGGPGVTGAELGDGSALGTDFVIVGVGVRPDVALAERAGLEIDNGIAVDARGRTSDPSIWAAGDCASFPQRGGRLRLESVGNAIDMGELVAENMMGVGKDHVAKPWFWSDQYDVKLQIAGLGTGYDQIVTRRGESAVSFWYYAGDRLLAVDAMNDPRAYMIGKRLIEAGKSPDKAVIGDASVDLKPLLRA